MGHSNGVRLIVNDVTNHRIVKTIKQRMKTGTLLERDEMVTLASPLYE